MTKNKILTGTLGTIAEATNTDATSIRIMFCLLWFFTGIIPLTVVYFILNLIINKRREP